MDSQFQYYNSFFKFNNIISDYHLKYNFLNNNVKCLSFLRQACIVFLDMKCYSYFT